MKLVIDSININGDKLEAVLNFEADLRQYGQDYTRSDSLVSAVVKAVAEKLCDKLILEKGPEVMDKITTNQIVNAVIMKAAGTLSGQR